MNSIGCLSGLFSLWAFLSVSAMAQSLPNPLANYLAQLPAGIRVGVALESLTDSSLSFYHRADERVPSASVIKLPIMVTAMTAAEKGQLDLDEIHILTDSEKTGGTGVLQTYPNRSRISYTDLIRLMITLSDNTATNILIADVGRETVNTRMRELGLTQTSLNRFMMDSVAAREGRENVVTAREMNLLLSRIYGHSLLTPARCEQMLSFLKENEDTLTIPGRLPPTASGKPMLVAHKSGILPYVRADVGIVYAPRPFVLSVFVENAGTPAAGETIIAELARLAYDWLGR